jgi:O-antigen biosynthesis protein
LWRNGHTAGLGATQEPKDYNPDETVVAALSFELDPESVELVDGRTVARSLPVWLRLGPMAALPKGRWVRICYRTSFFDAVTRPLIRFDTSDGHSFTELMNGAILGRGAWIGYVPAKTVTVSINPVARLGPFAFVVDSIEPLSHGEVLRRTAAFEISRIAAELRERVFDTPDEVQRGLKLAGKVTPFEDYHAWHQRLARAIDLRGIDRPRADWQSTPAFMILLPLAGTSVADLDATIRSLRHQVYARWWLCAVHQGGDGADAALLAAYRSATAGDARCLDISRDAPLTALPHLNDRDCISLIDPGDTLPDSALAIVAETLARAGDVAVIYGDEDAISPDGALHAPRFKPDWSPIFSRATSYVGRSVYVRRSHLVSTGYRTIGEFTADENGILDIVSYRVGRAQVHHLPRVLYRRRALPTSRLAPASASVSASASASASTSVVAPLDFATLGGVWPEVTVVIPTRDHADLLRSCVRGLKHNTDYPDCDVIIMNNGSREPDALALLDDLRKTPRFTVVDRPGAFNFSALCNEGARVTNTPLLVFLNNDIEMIEDGWLKPLVRWAVLPDIGVVGAKLLYRGGAIQHAGVVVGLGGIAGHLYRKRPAKTPGYLDALSVPHEVTAVTGACIAIERSKFEAVGGFDAENLPVELNDIDLCLRVAERGWSTLWTPESVLCHHEYGSRDIGPDPSKTYSKERVYFRERWQHIIRDDPHFHPGLSLFSFEPVLA